MGRQREGATAHDMTHLTPVINAAARGAEIRKNNHTLAPHAFALHFSIHFRYTFQRHKQAPHTTQHTRQAARLRSSEDSHLGQLYSVVDVTQQLSPSLQDEIETKLGQVKTRSKGVALLHFASP